MAPAASITAAIVTIAIAALVFWLRQAPLQSRPRIQFHVAAPEGLTFPNRGTSPLATMSPDGRRLAFVTETSLHQTYQLWVEDLETGRVRSLPGTDNAWMPFWSPDGSRIGFQSSGALRIVDVEGNHVPQAIAELSVDGGAAWGVNGDIIFSNNSGGLSRATIGRGGAIPLTTPSRAAGEIRQLWPQILPDGRRFLYFSLRTAADQSGVFLSSLDAPQTAHRVLASRSAAVYAPPGYLLYVEGGDATLFARGFDAKTGELRGPAFAIASGVGVNYANGRVRFSTSETGVLAYSGAARAPLLEPVWFDRSGRRSEAPLAPDHYSQLELSADGRYVAAERYNPEQHEPDIVVADVQTGVSWRATSNSANDESPVWAADSQRFLYARHDGIMQPAQLVVHELTEPPRERTIFRSEDSKHPLDWSSDGRFVLFKVTGVSRKSDVWMIPTAAPSMPIALLTSEADEIDAKFSPDGRLIAYVSDHSGQFEVYVRPVMSTSESQLISLGGGAQPRWRADGRELTYLSAKNEVMSIRVNAVLPFAAGPPRPLFKLGHDVPSPITRVPFTMTREAERFLVGTLVRDAVSSITVLVSWWPTVSSN